MLGKIFFQFWNQKIQHNYKQQNSSHYILSLVEVLRFLIIEFWNLRIIKFSNLLFHEFLNL